MTHVITAACCKDGDCVRVCPVDCIHPTPDEPGYGSAEMLYIDASTCIDCGACIDACPVSAITSDYVLMGDVSAFQHLADLHYRSNDSPVAERRAAWPSFPRPRPSAPEPRPRVAVVGTGPSGMYAVAALLEAFADQVEIDLLEALPVPGGLVRYGVAPDHPQTKQVADVFEDLLPHPRVTCVFGVAVGVDISHEDLLETHHAVVYAVGAPRGARAPLPGIELAGSHTAAELVAWYNGHPEFAELQPDLSGEHAVIIGNGNVALDVARILTASVEDLARSDIAPAALEALADSAVRRVTILGRRGPEDAAFTTPELLGLIEAPGVAVRARQVEPSAAARLSPLQEHRMDLLRRLGQTRPEGSSRLVEMRFWTAPTRLLGVGVLSGVEVVDARDPARIELLPCSLVVSSVGHRRNNVPGVPLDAGGGLVHDSGRVLDPATGAPQHGVYAVGWFKRGASGQIGDNKRCSRETVQALKNDLEAGRLRAPSLALRDVLAPGAGTGLDGWRAIDAAERSAALGVPASRRKITHLGTMQAVARRASAG